FTLNLLPPTLFLSLSLHDALPISCDCAGDGTAKASARTAKTLRVARDVYMGTLLLGVEGGWVIFCCRDGEILQNIAGAMVISTRSEEHTSKLHSLTNLVCPLLL